MAGKRIKGITIELDGETKGLEKALSNVNKKSTALQSELKDVEHLLKFNPSNVEALAQKQKLLTDQIENTTEKLNQLKNAEKQVQAQFAKGDITEEQYRAFRREIEFTEGSLNGLNNKLASLKSEQEKVGTSTKQLNTLFEAIGKSVDDFSDSLGSGLTNAIKKGTATSKQLETAIQKIGKEALGAEADLDKMKKALSSVDDGASLKNVRKELNKVSKEADEAKGSIAEFNVELENMLGAAVAGGGISGAVEKALDITSLDTKIEISMEVPEESKEAVRDAINVVKSYGVDAEGALEGVRRQWALNKDASDSSNAAIIKGAGMITAAYSGIDFTELIQETNEIANELNISNEEALGLTKSLLNIGFPPEQLDIIAEYGKQLYDAGFNAQEVQAIMAAGVETGTWNIDNLLDGLKEGRIKLAEFGQEVPKATADLLKNTDISTKQLQDWGKAVAEGGKTGREAMQEVVKALLDVDDETKRNALGVQFFGTMWEDQTTNITDTLLNMDQHLVTSKENIDGVTDATAKLDATPAVQMQQAFSDMVIALEPLLTLIAEFITKIAEWISNNPQLAATIAAIVTALGIFLGICLALAPIFVTISSLAGALGVAFGAVAGPVMIVIGIITALIAIGIALWQNWDTVVAKAQEIWGWLASFFSDFWSSTLDVFNNALDWIDQVTDGKFSAITDAIRSYLEMADRNIKSILKFIQNTFQNALDFIVALVTGDFEGMGKAIGNQMDNIDQLIQDIWGNVMDFLEGIDLIDIGKNIIQGLMDGVSSMADNLIESVKGPINDAIEGAKNLLGIHSPSRVFMEIGEFTGEGFEIGMMSMLNDIQRASEKMAEISLPRLPKTDDFQIGKPKKSGKDDSSTSDNFNFDELVNAIIALANRDVVLSINDREFARTTGPAMSKELNNLIKVGGRKGGVVFNANNG